MRYPNSILDSLLKYPDGTLYSLLKYPDSILVEYTLLQIYVVDSGLI